MGAAQGGEDQGPKRAQTRHAKDLMHKPQILAYRVATVTEVEAAVADRMGPYLYPWLSIISPARALPAHLD